MGRNYARTVAEEAAAARRAELGSFLRARREQLDRAEFGLPPVPRRRTGGLRREEIAYLSGVSVTWYTWLEQGRDINPSRQVLDAVGRQLRLSPEQQAYVLSLAGYSPPRPGSPPAQDGGTGHLRRLLDTLDTSPGFTVGADWTIVDWNRAYQLLFPRVATVDPAERNLLWLVFTDPGVRLMLPHWEQDSLHFLAEFRAAAGPRLGEPAHAGLVERLRRASPEFRAGWADHQVEGFASRARQFRHPEVGELVFEHHRLVPSDHPELHLVIYTPLAGTPTAERMAALLSGPA